MALIPGSCHGDRIVAVLCEIIRKPTQSWLFYPNLVAVYHGMNKKNIIHITIYLQNKRMHAK